MLFGKTILNITTEDLEGESEIFKAKLKNIINKHEEFHKHSCNILNNNNNNEDHITNLYKSINELSQLLLQIDKDHYQVS